MWFKFLLFPGKTWAQNAHWETPADDVYGIEDVRGKVVGWEKVTVPAGTYKALRVELRDRVIETGGVYDLVTLTYGYVPDVNRFVKYSYRSIYEGAVDAEMVSYKTHGALRILFGRNQANRASDNSRISMSGGLAIGFYLIVYNRDRVDVVTGVTGLADCRGNVVLVPLALRLVHFLFFGLNGLRQAELRDVRIDLRLALDDYERVGTGLAPLAFQRRQRLVLLISNSPSFDHRYPSMGGQRFRIQNWHKAVVWFWWSVEGGGLRERSFRGSLWQYAACRE